MKRVIIVSDGSPGAARGALDAAIQLALDYQGWGHLVGRHPAEGDMPMIYASHMRNSPADDMGMVRRVNAQDSDGTLVFSTSMVLSGVAAYMDKVTERMGCAFMHVAVPPGGKLRSEIVLEVQEWIRDNDLTRVYVTGTSEHDAPGIQRTVAAALAEILEPFATEEIAHVTGVMAELSKALVVEDAEGAKEVARLEAAYDGRPLSRPLEDIARDIAAVGGQPSHIVIPPENVELAIAAGLDVIWRTGSGAPISHAEALAQVAHTGSDDVRDIAAFLVSLECCSRPPSHDDVKRLSDKFYALPGNGAGGSLHVVLDDHNWERDSVEFCRKWAADRGDVAGERFAELLLTLSDDQLHAYLGPSYCGRCCADYGDSHTGQTFDNVDGRCPDCGSWPASGAA